MTDSVNQPEHYNAGSIECIDAIRAAMPPAAFHGFLQGNIIKYVWRHRHKGGILDLKKAEWYLKLLIEEQASIKNE
jgi:hypothetical protein